MKIGIISDSHKKSFRVAYALEQLLKDGAEFFIHAGDIVQVESLELLKKTQKRYIAVYGNNDAHLASQHNNYNLVQEPYYFKLEKTSFKLMHLPFFMNADCEVILYGHTHTFSCEFINKTLFLNPGEVCARNKDRSEFVLLEILPDSFLVTYYYRDEKMERASLAFATERFSFTRIKHA